VKVLHYLRHLGLGGTDKTCQLFFENASEDFQVAVAYESGGNNPRLGEFVKSAKVCGGTLYAVDSYQDGPSGLPVGSDLQAVINEFKPDILHVYRSGFQEFPVCYVGVRHVVETNVFGFLDPSSQIDRSLFMSKWLMDYALRNKTIPSEYQNRFHFVNNPVEDPFTSDKLAEVVRWKKENPDCVVLGRVGRPDNGIYNAVNVNAARLLRMQGHDVRFVVVAPPENMVKDLIAFEIPFFAIEPTTDPLILSTAYNSMDIYAHARADGETFGVNIAEAMIHGLPVVTHIATPSHPGMGVFQSQTELVDDRETGFIVNNDPAEYAGALKELLLPAIRMALGDNGRAKALKEYHVDACVQKLERIYKEVINGSA
jgi:glycosyltransferase involved in cell wall biosynthesis